MTTDEPLFIICKSLGTFGITSTQLHEIYHTVQVVFGYFIMKIVHIVPLSAIGLVVWARLKAIQFMESIK